MPTEGELMSFFLKVGSSTLILFSRQSPELICAGNELVSKHDTSSGGGFGLNTESFIFPVTQTVV